MKKENRRPRGLTWWALVALTTIAAVFAPEKAHAQLAYIGDYRVVRGNGAPHLAVRPEALEGLTPLPRSRRETLRGIRPQRQALLGQIRQLRQGQPTLETRERVITLRSELTELECTTACMSADDQNWCRTHAANEWEEWDLTLPATADGIATVCQENGANDGACQWRRVQALSAYTCETVRSRSFIAAARAATRDAFDRAERTELAAARAARVVEVTTRAEAAEAEGRTLREQLAAAQARIAELLRQAAERLAANAPPEGERPRLREAPVDEESPSRRRVRHARRPTLDREVQGMSCSECRATGHGTQCVSICEIRRSNPASAGFLARVLREPNLHRASGQMAGLSHLHPRLQRHARVIQAIIESNPGTTEEASPIIYACHRTTTAPGQRPYFVQRHGVSTRSNGDATPVTLESFVSSAATACGANPRVEIWGVNHMLVRLRFDSPPNEGGSTGERAEETVPRARTQTTTRLAAATVHPSTTEASLGGAPGEDTEWWNHQRWRRTVPWWDPQSAIAANDNKRRHQLTAA